MSLIDKAEKKFGNFSIPNLTLIIILGRIVLYFAGISGSIKFEDTFLVGSFVLKG